jgi:Zn-dependent oligopeptidase
MVQDFDIEVSMRVDLFRAKTAAEATMKASGEWDTLGPEERRLVEKMILDGKRAGLMLPESEREELVNLEKELSKTCLEFDVRILSCILIFRLIFD